MEGSLLVVASMLLLSAKFVSSLTKLLFRSLQRLGDWLWWRPLSNDTVFHFALSIAETSVSYISKDRTYVRLYIRACFSMCACVYLCVSVSARPCLCVYVSFIFSRVRRCIVLT